MRPFTLDRLASLYNALPRDTFYRHDCDVSLDAALAMARWETEREVHATYYLMHTSPFYTAREAMGAALVLARLGHRVGLHLDVREQAPGVLNDPRQLRPPVSFHCPPPHLLWRDFAAFESAYALRWKGRYYSDSRGRFAYGDPEDHAGDWPIQVSLHAEHWYEPDYLERRGVTREQYARFWHEPMEAHS